MKPVDDALQLIQQQQQQIPLLVEVFAKADDDRKFEAAQLLQQALGQEKLIAPVQQELYKQANRVNPIDLLDHLWDLQTNVLYVKKPTERLHQMKLATVRYLTDTGIADYLPEQTQAWLQKLNTSKHSEQFMTYFHRWFPEWLDLQFAIADGFIACPLDVYRWKKHRPQRFQWGKRAVQKWMVLRHMPPIVRDWLDSDPEYQIDCFAPRAQAFVRKEQ